MIAAFSLVPFIQPFRKQRSDRIEQLTVTTRMNKKVTIKSKQEDIDLNDMSKTTIA